MFSKTGRLAPYFDRPTPITFTLCPVRRTSAAKFIILLLVLCVVSTEFLNTFGPLLVQNLATNVQYLILFRPDQLTPKRFSAIPKIPNKLLFTTPYGGRNVTDQLRVTLYSTVAQAACHTVLVL